MNRRSARVVVILHRDDRRRKLSAYGIWHLAEIWRAQGLEVLFLFGTGEAPPADLAILHVDLSIVPERYVRLARRYPIALNTRLTDIRKSTYSRQLVTRNTSYQGQVIVKTDHNNAGIMERRQRDRSRVRRLAGLLPALRARWRGVPRHPILEKSDYRVFDHPREVHEPYWDHPDLIVEKFLPERTETGYAVRNCFVLGDTRLCERAESPSPLVSDATTTRVTRVEPHPVVSELCRSLHIDYAKIDYTLHQGEPIILDVNKTVGASARGWQELDEHRRRWAIGLQGYLEGRRLPA